MSERHMVEWRRPDGSVVSRSYAPSRDAAVGLVLERYPDAEPDARNRWMVPCEPGADAFLDEDGKPWSQVAYVVRHVVQSGRNLMPRVTFRAPPEEMAAIDAAAEREGQTRNDWLRGAARAAVRTGGRK